MATKIELPEDPDYKDEDTAAAPATDPQLELDLGGDDEQRQADTTTPDDDDNVEVEVIDDTPPEDRGRTPLAKEVFEPTDEEMDEYNSKVQKRIRELTRAKHDERRRADALARERAELERASQAVVAENRRLQEYISMGQTAYIEKSKAYAAALTESAKAALTQAYDAGDAAAITAAQEKLTAAQLLQQEANNFRATPLQTPQQPAYNNSQEVPRAAAQPDERTQAWHKANPWFQRAGDEAMTAYAMQTHAELVRQYGPGYTSTPEYYQHIDEAMRKVFPEKFSQATTPAAKPRPTTVVAPAQRGTATKKIRLTQSQINVADKLGISYAGYARQLAALEKNNG